MKILLINHYAGSLEHGMEYRPFYLGREWVRHGHCVTILAASHSHVRTQQPAMNGARVRHESISGIDYRWYSTPSYTGNGVGRVRNMAAFVAQLHWDAKALARELQPDVVIASSTYPMDIWAARKIARAAGARLVFEVHDLWPLSPIELGGMSPRHPFIRLVQRAEDYAYRHADIVVSMLPKTLEYMCSRGLTSHKWRHVPNGIDPSEWQAPSALPIEVDRRLRDIKLKGLPLIAYAGTHGLANALDTLLECAKMMSGEAEWVLVGNGPERERLLRRVNDEQIGNVHMLPAIPKESVPALLAAVDIAYLGLQPQPLYRFGISLNKMMDYMMAAKPIIMVGTAGNDMVRDAGCGESVRSGDVVDVRAAILRLHRLPPSELQVMGERGRAYITAKHVYSTLATQFVDAVGG
ncbi:MAG: glycosyltransferase family 4 protein [Proteobacteria bacterium]|nr:glycosyltransferase family 4 protein [Pseudomonadota bacterium]